MARIPTYDDFKRGLRAGALADIDLDTLDCFLRAPGYARTATELAAQLGNADGHSYGNLRVGTLGSKLADAMSFTPNRRSSNDEPMYWNVIASGHHRDEDDHFVFTLHDDLVAALGQFPRKARTERLDLGATPEDERPELTDEQRARIAQRRAERRLDR